MESKLLYEVSDAIRKELATLNVERVCEMSKETGCTDLTPFNLLAEKALQQIANYAYRNGDRETIIEISDYI